MARIKPLDPGIKAIIAQHIVKTATGKAPSVEDLTSAISEVTFETQTLGAALLQVTVIDPGQTIVRSGFLDKDSDGLLPEIDINFPDGSDYWWRLAMIDVTGDLSSPNVTLTFQTRFISYLQNKWGPKGVAPGTTTRAQFIKQLVDEVGKGDGLQPINFLCPELNIVQPLATTTTVVQKPGSAGTTVVASKAQMAAALAKINKGGGVGIGANLKVKGQPMTQGQAQAANTLLGVGAQQKAGITACYAIIYAAMGESSLTTGEPGGGILQGTSFPNPSDDAAEAMAFFNGGQGFQGGGAIALSRTVSDPIVIANTVEANLAWITTHTDSYGHQWPGGSAQGIAEAKAIVAAYGLGQLGGASQGTAPNAVISDIAQLTRGTTDDPDEDSWTCIQRLVADLNWQAFVSGPNTLCVIDGPTLDAQSPAVYLDLADDATEWTATNPSDGRTAENVVTGFEGVVDNTMFKNQAARKVKGKVQRATRIRKPQTPSQLRFSMVCGVLEYPAGSVMVLRNTGPFNDRWIVEDATRNCLADIFTQFTLGPPTAPNPEPTGTLTSTAMVNKGLPGSVSAGGYVNPLSKISSLTPSRIDMGVDYGGGGGPLVALGNGRIFNVAGAGWPGGVFIGLTLSDGAYAGKHVYYAEQLTASVSVRQIVKAGDVVGTLHPGSSALEIGWASGNSDEALAASLNQQASGDPGGWSSAAGWSFNTLLVSLGAPSGGGGTTTPAPGHGTMPPGYPDPGGKISNVPGAASVAAGASGLTQGTVTSGGLTLTQVPGLGFPALFGT